MVLDSFPDLCVADVDASAGFYTTLLGLTVRMNHGWYVELGNTDATLLALVQSGHRTVPRAAGDRPTGLLVSFEVDDATAYAQTATRMGCVFVLPLTDELGQRHFMVLDPNGAVVDVIERIALTRDDLRALAVLRRAARSSG